MFDIKDDEIDVDQLMLGIREAARRKAESLSSSNNSPAQPVGTAPLNGSPATPREAFSLNTGFQQRDEGYYSTGEMLKYYDREFIENAYRAILKREPEWTGYASYLEHLRCGRLDRLDILASLRSSVEGREKNVNIEGLYWPSMIRRLYRLPALGYFIEWLVELGRLPLLIRQQRQFEAYLHIRQERIVAHINQLSEETGSYFERLGLEMRRLAEIEEQRTLELSERFELRAQSLSEQLEAQARASDERLEARTRALDEKFERRARTLDEKIAAEAQALDERLEAERAEARAEAGRLKTETERLEAEAAQLRAEAAQLKAQAEQFSRKLQATRTELAFNERRARLLLEELGRLSQSPAEQESSQALADAERHFSDALYSSFEEHFRGSRKEIIERLQVYLPILRDAGISGDILDIGCGRGEWLEVLLDAGMRGSGIDTNRVQVEACQSLGLEVKESEAVAYLRELPEHQLNAVTGFHVIEHLEFESLVSLLDEIMRVLRPGGLVIFETPNPENVAVASHNFYVDPTHRHPLPIPMMKFLLDARGFHRIEVIKLHPSETPKVEGSTDLVERFNEYFYGPMDYAIIGRKV